MFIIFSFVRLVSSNINGVEIGKMIYDLYDNKTASLISLAKNERVDNLTVDGTVLFDNVSYSVISLGNRCFNEKEICGSVVLPDELLYIGDRSFRYTLITSVTFGKKLERIGEEAFSYCYNLSCKLDFPNTLSYIGNCGFAFSQIKGFNSPQKLTVLNEGVFKSTALTDDLYFSQSIIEIGDYAFYNTSIKTINLGDVEIIGNSAFHSSTIKSVRFGNNLKIIRDEAFSNCSSFSAEIFFSHTLRELGNNCFKYSPIRGTVDCSMLKFLGEGCFSNTYISQIIFPPSIVTIPAYCFAFSSLEGKVHLPITVVKIDKCAFRDTIITSLNIPPHLSIICDMAFFLCDKLSCTLNFKDFELIGTSAFAYTSIDINGISCRTISSYAFTSCNFISNDLNVDCISIGEGAFSDCSKIRSIDLTLHSSTNVSIPSHLFSDCISIKSIEIKSTKLVPIVIEEGAFKNCNALQEIILPLSITKIGKNAFYFCSSYSGNLDLLQYPNLTDIDDFAYFGCNNLIGEIKLPPSLKKIGKHVFSGCMISGSVFIPDNVTIIGDFSFYGCKELTGNLYIGNSVEVIGESAFARCKNLSGNIIIGEKVTKISNNAFFGCYNLKGNLILPKNLKEIGYSAFYECKSLQGKLKFSDKLEKIGNSAFAECRGFTKRLVIPKSVKFIGQNAFFGCTGFKDVYFENKQISIGQYAFSNMHIHCFSNTPEIIKIFPPKMYNFNGMILGSSEINFFCDTFYFLNIVVTGFTAIGGGGIFVMAGKMIFDWYTSRKSNINKYTVVFSDIIQKALTEEDKVGVEETTNRIINGINEYVQTEMGEDEVTLTEKQANAALNNSIQNNWATIPAKYNKEINKVAFNDIEFRETCYGCKLNCKCCCKSKDYNEDSSEGNIILQSII